MATLTLAAIRRARGVEGAAAALREALAAHPTRADAARALGVAPQNLRRVAARLGVELELLPAGRRPRAP